MLFSVWMAAFAGANELKSTEVLNTRDGVVLEADLYLQKPGAPGVVLLHMIPPHYERSSWPVSFLDGLVEQGYSLCVVDRRGAGQSKGVAKEAYEGPKGRYDVEACVKRLAKHGIGKLGVIGASNGTTSALDYALWAAEDPALPDVAAMGLMTGGTYTENQNKVSLAKQIPAVFTYSTEEREWSVAQKEQSKSWVFHEYPGGAHGTKMFAKKPAVTGDLLSFLAEKLAP